MITSLTAMCGRESNAGNVDRLSPKIRQGDLQLAGRMLGLLRVVAPVRLNIGRTRGDDFPALERDRLIVRCDSTWPREPQIFDRWNRLLERTDRATVFNSSAWQRVIAERLVPPSRLRIISVQRGEELLAFFALSLRAGSLETPGKWVSDFLEPLVDPAAAQQCWPLILQLLDGLCDWSIRDLTFHNIPVSSSLGPILQKIAPQYGFVYEERVVNSAPFLVLPDSWEQYLAMLSSNERKNQRKKIRQAEIDGQARWITVHTMDQIAPVLERGLAALCQSEGPKGNFARTVLAGFIRRVVPDLVRHGDFFMHELWLQGKPAAWQFMLRSGQGPMGYNTAYNRAMRDWSPGSTAFAMTIRSAIEQKYPKLNFLRGAEEFKTRLGCDSIDLLKISLLRTNRQKQSGTRSIRET